MNFVCLCRQYRSISARTSSRECILLGFACLDCFAEAVELSRSIWISVITALKSLRFSPKANISSDHQFPSSSAMYNVSPFGLHSGMLQNYANSSIPDCESISAKFEHIWIWADSLQLLEEIATPYHGPHACKTLMPSSFPHPPEICGLFIVVTANL